MKKKHKQKKNFIRKWKRRIKFAKGTKKVFKLIIKILGPTLSTFLMVDGFMNKDKKA